MKVFLCFLWTWTKEYKVRQVQESAPLKVKKVPIKYECQLEKVGQWRFKYDGHKSHHK